MHRLIAVFDDERDLERATSELAQAGLEAWVLDEGSQGVGEPLPPQVDGASAVPFAPPHTPLVADAMSGRGRSAPALADLADAVDMDDEVADRYARLAAGGATLLVVQAEDENLGRAEELLRASRASDVARFEGR